VVPNIYNSSGRASLSQAEMQSKMDIWIDETSAAIKSIPGYKICDKWIDTKD
jgi:hypothetical protein